MHTNLDCVPGVRDHFQFLVATTVAEVVQVLPHLVGDDVDCSASDDAGVDVGGGADGENRTDRAYDGNELEGASDILEDIYRVTRQDGINLLMT